jgi:hypothetical protein
LDRLPGSWRGSDHAERHTHVLPGDLELARKQFDLFLTEELAKRLSR